MTPTCVIADSSPIYLAGLRVVLDDGYPVQVAAQATHPSGLMDAVAEHDPDLLILGFEPLQLSLDLTTQFLSPVLLLTWSRRKQDIADAMRSRARGMMHKDAGPRQLRATISSLLAGSVVFPGTSLEALAGVSPGARRSSDSLRLTRREGQILDMITAGMPTRQIAASLGIAGQTVKNHNRVLMVKAGVASRAELVVWAEGRTQAMLHAESG